MGEFATASPPLANSGSVSMFATIHAFLHKHSTATALVTYTHITAEPSEIGRNLDCGIRNENFRCHIANVK